MYFRVKFALYFRFFDSWYIIKYLLTETSGKQYVLWTLDCRCFPRLRLGKHRQSRVHKTYCFPRSQSISVKSYLTFPLPSLIRIYMIFIKNIFILKLSQWFFFDEFHKSCITYFCLFSNETIVEVNSFKQKVISNVYRWKPGIYQQYT